MKFLSRLFGQPKAEADFTTISRTQIVDGFSIPGIILNGNYFLTDLQVYRDGLIYCWEMVDLELFRKKLNKEWVVTAIPDGNDISVYSLGQWTVDKGDWLFDKESFYEHIHALVKRLNPRLENLHNCHGRTTEKVGNVNKSILGSPDPEPYYISVPNATFPTRTNGQRFHIFFKNDDGLLYLADIAVYKNDHIEITNIPEKKAYEFSGLRQLIDDKIILSDVQVGERVHIMGIGSFAVTGGRAVDIENKYKEFLDCYKVLRGEESSVDKCRRIFAGYKANPTIKCREELKVAYEMIPVHQRAYVGDMDTKDVEVRMIIYGEQEIERWSHYLLAKERGEPLPRINIPKPKDEQ